MTPQETPAGPASSPKRRGEQPKPEPVARWGEQPYDQVWCVFNKDDSEPGRIHAAIERAQALGLHVAYSNQCFEFWLLLHFTEHPGGGQRRKLCGSNLEAHDPAARPTGQSRRALAIRRAGAIDARWQASGRPQ